MRGDRGVRGWCQAAEARQHGGVVVEMVGEWCLVGGVLGSMTCAWELGVGVEPVSVLYLVLSALSRWGNAACRPSRCQRSMPVVHLHGAHAA